MAGEGGSLIIRQGVASVRRARKWSGAGLGREREIGRPGGPWAGGP